ncbi:MAG: Bifunctional homocysteine S-methyltransferase/5,10-methylenetetrahydrofolate reductase [Betaproteobacteria bacterium ADurb.Bin341]|nr:MAG: Bifunctional homocysteine S-methyltransferase/5,10-methylenetetrahydrofolate reductase [Betaproteobacteria bacterium ADurb.Bin341]
MSPVKSNLQAVLQAGKFAVTAEAGPPRGVRPEVLRDKARILKGWVDACNVTDNQTSVVRLCSLAACKILQDEGQETVMQMVCRDRNRIAAQSDILGAAALGIHNLLCLSGDHQVFGDHPQAKNVFDIDSIQLLNIATRMRDESKFAGGKDIDGAPDLFIGASANPFADPFKIQVPRLAKKVAAGAQFIQTQSIFDLEKFKEWMNGVRDRGLHEQTAILAGITPIKSLRMAEYMATNVAGMDVPDAILERMRGVDKKEQKQEGIKIAVETIQQLREVEGVRGIHIMAIEWEEAVPEIVQQAGLVRG